MKTLVVNFYGGPGSGKSTMAAGLFERLKWAGVNCEIATEYAKDKTWEGSFGALNNQVTVFGKQFQRLFRCEGQVEVIITDAPLINSIVYNKEFGVEFDNLVLKMYERFDNMNYFIARCKPYNPKGRSQTEDEAKAIDEVTFNLLQGYNIKYDIIDGVPESVDVIAAEILKKLGR